MVLLVCRGVEVYTQVISVTVLSKTVDCEMRFISNKETGKLSTYCAFIGDDVRPKGNLGSSMILHFVGAH